MEEVHNKYEITPLKNLNPLCGAHAERCNHCLFNNNFVSIAGSICA